MKRIIVLFTVLSIAIGCTHAQQPTKGYRGFVDKHLNLQDGGFGLWLPMLESGLSTTHGYQFNNKYFLGAGVELNHFIFKTISSVPLYVDSRINWAGTKTSPYFDLRLGYDLHNIMPYGLYISPSVGMRMPLNNSIGLNFSAGLNIRFSDVFFEDGQNHAAIALRCGIDF